MSTPATIAETGIDPITLAVIQNGLQQVCNEMDLAFCRAAFSPVISEAMDRSDGIYSKEDGSLIAQGELGLPVFVGTMQFSTRAVIERVRDNGWTLEPGDVFIVNDPYLGGTHLMDVKFVKPFFYRGKVFAWLANTGHWPDTGGMVPGGFSAHATESEQELDERLEQRMSGARRGGEFRMELHTDKPRMHLLRQFHDFGKILCPACGQR